MATEASSAAVVRGGVAPLRAGEGNSFLLRRLHSLSGIIPVGTFLIEHFISNAFATNGPNAYVQQVKFLTGLPFAFWLEVFGIYIPILFHGLYGGWIWWKGDNNVTRYPWTGNWLYTVQRWTGIIAFAYILYHTWYMRFDPAGVHLFDHPDAAFWKVQNEFATKSWAMWAYAAGIIAASWHFGYGLFLFAAKWGLVIGERAQKRMQVLSIAVALGFAAVGLYTMKAFLQPHSDWPRQEYKQEWKHSPAEIVPGSSQ